MSLNADELAAQIAERNAKMEAMKAARLAKKSAPKTAAPAPPAPPAAPTPAPAPAAAPTPPAAPAAPPVVAPEAAPVPPPVQEPIQDSVPLPPAPPSVPSAPPSLVPTPVTAPTPPPMMPQTDTAELVSLREQLNEQTLRVSKLTEQLSEDKSAATEVVGLRESEAALQQQVTQLQTRLREETGRSSVNMTELQMSQTKYAETQAETRRLEFEVDRVQHDMESLGRRLQVQFDTRVREEVFLWIEHIRIEVEQVEDRAVLEKMESDKKIFELLKQEGSIHAVKAKTITENHDVQVRKFQDEIKSLEEQLRGAVDAQAKHEQLAALARRQLEDHKDLQEKETNNLLLDKQRRMQELKKLNAEKDEAVARIEQVENETTAQKKTYDEMRLQVEQLRRERQEAVNQLAEEREDRMRALKGLKDQLFKREQERDEYIRKIPELEEERAQLEERVRSMEHSRRALEEEARVLRREREEAESKVGEVRQQFREKQKGDEMEILRLLRNDRSWRIERAEMEEEIKRLSSDLTTKTKDSLSVQKEFAHLAKKTNKAQRKRRDLEKEHYEMAERLHTLTRDGFEARQVMLGEVAEIKKRHKKAAGQYDKEVDKIKDEWETKVRSQEDELVKCHVDLSQKSKKIEELKSKVKDLQRIEKYSSGMRAGTSDVRDMPSMLHKTQASASPHASTVAGRGTTPFDTFTTPVNAKGPLPTAATVNDDDFDVFIPGPARSAPRSVPEPPHTDSMLFGGTTTPIQRSQHYSRNQADPLTHPRTVDSFIDYSQKQTVSPHRNIFAR